MTLSQRRARVASHDAHNRPGRATAAAGNESAPSRACSSVRTRGPFALVSAPEVAAASTRTTVRSGEPASTATDVYSLGVLSYQLLTGRIPIGRFSLPSQVNPNLPPELDPIVLRCLSHNPDERYSDVASMLRELERVEDLVGFRLLDNLKIISQSASSALKAKTTRIVRQNRARVLTAVVLGTALFSWAAIRSFLRYV